MFTPELIILLVGIVGVFAGLEKFQNVLQKPKWVIWVLVAGLATQTVTQILQYANVNHYRTTSERAVEREVAFALHALAQSDVGLLKQVAPKNPYVVGYALFKNGKYDDAIPHFKKALDNKSFVAPSNYMLGYLILQDPSRDVEQAIKHLDAAIELDQHYAPAYYARAIAAVQARKFATALADLRTSVKYGIGQCRDLNSEEELNKIWKPVREMPEFQRIQRECLSIYDLPVAKRSEMTYWPY